MAVPYYGDFAEDQKVYLPFNTFSSDDPAKSITITELAAGDIKVHKDGAIAQLVTDGATVEIDFDGITGNHLLTIDTAAHADYTTGSEYTVRIEGAVIDLATSMNMWIGSFSIERTGGAIALLTGVNSLADIEGKIDIIDTNVDATLLDTGELQVDDYPTTIAALQTDLDTLTAVCTEVRLATLTDWINGGRLDLLLDAIPTTAMRGTDSANTVVPRSAAQIKTEVAAALVDIHLDHLLAADYDPAIKPGVATALFNELIESDAGVSRYTVNALEQGPSDSGASAGAIADAVWDEAQADHLGGTTFGAIATEIALIPTTAMRGTDSAYTGTPPTVQQIEDEVWNALQSAHVGADSMGVIASEIAAIPTTAMRGTDSAYTGGNITGNLSGSVGSVTGNVGGSVGSLTGHTNQTGDTYALANGASGFVAIKAVVDALDALTKALGGGDLAAIKTAADAVKVVTDKFVFTVANEVNANTKSINDAEVVGDGNAVPWDGV